MIRSLLQMFALLGILALPVAASAGAGHSHGLHALARIDPAQSSVRDTWGGGVEIRLAMSQAVPWRIILREGPDRLIVDFREVSWQGVRAEDLVQGRRILSVATGQMRPGWSRFVAQMQVPMQVASAEMVTDESEGTAEIIISLKPASRDTFQAAVASTDTTDLWSLPQETALPVTRPRQIGERDLMVVLDPGHGGIDPGAQRAGIDEASKMLLFARELREALLRRGGFDVVLTRESDVFVPLSERISIARAAQADVFLSLHADALEEGAASGATVYIYGTQNTDEAARRLAARHARDDLILGADLSEQGDEIAAVLMDMARREVTPRSRALAGALVAGLRGTIGPLHKRPLLEGDFVVLRAPDMPSALIELGFLSDADDLANLQDMRWRAFAAEGIVRALEAWAVTDAAEALNLRR